MNVLEMGQVIRLETSEVSAFTIPTDSPESDGTIEWNSTTLIVVKVNGGGCQGLGYTYAHSAAAFLIRDMLLPTLHNSNVMDIGGIWEKMMKSVRNIGRPGIASMAIAAVDTALWDLKAKILNLPLVSLLGAVRKEIPVYGSGGFTSYPLPKLLAQMDGWAADGIKKVKMKIGRNPGQDLNRVKEVTHSLHGRASLFVDANGAYTRKQALQFASEFSNFGVKWFEEPVSSDDLDGLRFLSEHGPGGLDIAAGEYGFDSWYFKNMLEAKAVTVLQADATRCGGYTGFIKAAALAEAYHIPLSSHCAPALHLSVCCACQPVVHSEYFYDHVRIEEMLFDGVVSAINGCLTPDLSRPGIGLDFKIQDAEKYKVF